MTDLEISKALALAIGWKPEQVLHNLTLNKMEILNEDDGVIEWFKTFDYRDWSVVGPIAERYDVFPYRTYQLNWAVESSFADTPQKAIALAAIGILK
jgi:hypothetical protein